MAYTMNTDHAAIGVYSNHEDADKAIAKLKQSNISLDRVSLVGGDIQSQYATQGNYSPPEFVVEGLQQQSERTGIWMGGALGLLAGCGSFFMPDIGMLMVLGPMAGLASGMGAGAIIGGLTGEMTFHDIASDYRHWLSAGNFLVIVHCSTSDESEVKLIMESTNPILVQDHPIRPPTD